MKLTSWFVEKSKYAASIGFHRLVIAFDGKRLVYQQYEQF